MNTAWILTTLLRATLVVFPVLGGMSVSGADEKRNNQDLAAIGELVSALQRDVAPGAGCGANCQKSQSLVIDGRDGDVVRGIRIDGTLGDCITVKGGAKNITIENVELAGCGRHGVHIDASSNVTVRNVFVRDLAGNAVDIDGSMHVSVMQSRLENAATGVYAHKSSGVRVEHNLIRNVFGPEPRGQGVQFDKVHGAENGVVCNTIVNERGKSAAEDAINLFRTRGLPGAPVVVSGNRILGGGPSKSGGGILAGDFGGAYIRVEQNRLVDPGQYGISIAGGTNMEILDNRVFARRQSFTNVGFSVWKADNTSGHCFGHRVSGNEADYTGADGKHNPAWASESCGTVTGFDNDNRWDARLGPSILLDKIPVCSGH